MRSEGSVLIVGVGGQGVLLASHILAAVCLQSGCDVKKSEVHGMAQRGGIVFSHVRYGTRVLSPVIEDGEADALVALEWAEAVRWAPFVKPSGVVIAGSTQIVPPSACADRRTWAGRYPSADGSALGRRSLYLVDAPAVAKTAGVAKAANIVLLGTLSACLPFSLEAWDEAIRAGVPAHVVEGNLSAFAAGRGVQAVSSAPDVPASMIAAGEPRSFAVEVIDDWCKGCDICVRICPEDCLRLDDGGIARCVAPQRCTGCRLCEQLCPDFAIAVRSLQVAAHG